MRMILMASSRLLKKTHMLRCAQSSRINVLNTYASARRSIARLAYEIFDQPANTLYRLQISEEVRLPQETPLVTNLKAVLLGNLLARSRAL
jgi:hypothetical protein